MTDAVGVNGESVTHSARRDNWRRRSTLHVHEVAMSLRRVFPIPRPSAKSIASSSTSIAASVHSWHKRTLGDKIHELALISPKHVVALELLVDQTLRTIKTR